MRKVSVIVPIYNSGRFLRKCVDSILQQTYHNIEVILVDDGSTDCSKVICNDYAKTDDRVRVVHQENTGVSAARNIGIQLATGDYIQFVDSDDFIDHNMTEVMVTAIEKHSVSLVICGYKRIDPSTGMCIVNNYSSKVGYFIFDEMLKFFDHLYSERLINSPCNKLYRAQVIKENSVLYPKGIDLGEDLLFNLEIIKRCTSFQIISECPYNYVQYNNSLTLKSKYRDSIYENQKMLFENVIAIYPDVEFYSNQIKVLEILYTRALVFNVITHYARHTKLNCKKYIKKATAIRRDPVLKRTINKCEFKTCQEKILTFFFQRNMYASIYIYIKVKEYIRKKSPGSFTYLKKRVNHDDSISRHTTKCAEL